MYKIRYINTAFLFLFLVLLFYGTSQEPASDRQNQDIVFLAEHEVNAGITAVLDKTVFQLDLHSEDFKAVPLTPEEKSSLILFYRDQGHFVRNGPGLETGVKR